METELLQIAATLIMAISLLLIAMSLLQGILILKRQNLRSVRTYTHQVIKADLPWRESILKQGDIRKEKWGT